MIYSIIYITIFLENLFNHVLQGFSYEGLKDPFIRTLVIDYKKVLINWLKKSS